MQQQPLASGSTTPQTEPAETGETPADAPPKQVAMAMESLGRAGRLIADTRIGADRLLEAFFRQCSASSIQQTFTVNRQYLQDLRTIDGAVIAYAWKRQLAGQAGASAVDRAS